jgi:hypothetical protein
VLERLVRAWRRLGAEQRLAAFAAFGLFVSMLLPWYQQNAVVTGSRGEPLVSRNLSAFGVFSFVEAAVLLVAVGVLALLFARAERREFHLPGGDGGVVTGAGLWAALLLVWRLFDKPGIAGKGVAANVGIQWGIFFALGAAGLLSYAGSRMRRRRRPEPPLVERPRETRPYVEPAPAPPGTTVTRVLPPESRAARAARRPSVPEDQLTMGLDGEPPAPER